MARNLLCSQGRLSKAEGVGMMIQKMVLAGAALFLFFVASNVMGQTSLVMNIKSASIVVGGALLTGFLAFPVTTFKSALQNIVLLFRQTGQNHKVLVEQMETLALIRRKYGDKVLESEGAKIEHPFLRKGMELVVDRYDRYEIRNIMEREFEMYFSRKDSEVALLNTLARVAPAFGFVGTLIGLIDVLGNMQDPANIGQGMAIALLTTFYGLLASNFVFQPLSRKLSESIKSEVLLLNIIMDATMDISEQTNSRAVSHRLYSLLGETKTNRAGETSPSAPPRGFSIRPLLQWFILGK
jgi:chemotaxis protein MotA